MGPDFVNIELNFFNYFKNFIYSNNQNIYYILIKLLIITLYEILTKNQEIVRSVIFLIYTKPKILMNIYTIYKLFSNSILLFDKYEDTVISIP